MAIVRDVPNKDIENLYWEYLNREDYYLDLRDNYKRGLGKRELAGRIEAVKLVMKFHHKRYSVGVLDDGDHVIVSNGLFSLNDSCLVKFDYESRTTRGNFISSHVPEGFSGLGPEDYIFYAPWKNWMPKMGKFPRLYEINGYLDPGHFCWAIYSNKKEKFSISKKRLLNLSYLNYEEIINQNLPNPKVASRLIISESKGELDKIYKSIISMGYVPVQVDNFKENIDLINQLSLKEKDL
jgi:hypothetical protein